MFSDNNTRKGKKRGMQDAVPPNLPDEQSSCIPLSQNRFAIVDKSDSEWLNQWNWCAAKSRGTFYAMHGVSGGGSVLMHRMILNAPDGVEVDHINGDGLDNRRSNLRLVTRAENLRHRRTFSNSKSGYKGVAFNPVNGRWKATLNIGTFDSAEEAALAYDRVIRRLFGSLAKTNFDDVCDES